MYEILPVAGCTGGECYLFKSEGSAVLIDSGFDFCADKAAENIQAALDGRPLDYILLTHSHYDHAGGSAKIRRAFPGAQVAASRLAAEIFQKPNAVALMRSLNANAARELGWPESEDRLDELRADRPLDDGDVIRLGDATVRAVSTPGHTRCCVSYLFEEAGMLACSETVGIITRYPEVAPCLIIGYGITMESIERLRALRPRRVFVSHTGLIPEADTERFFDTAAQAVRDAAALIVDGHKRDLGADDIAREFMDRFFDAFREVQPEQAFLINTQALIPRILKEFNLTPDHPAR